MACNKTKKRQTKKKTEKKIQFVMNLMSITANDRQWKKNAMTKRAKQP